MKYTVESLIKELQTHNPKSRIALVDWDHYCHPILDFDISKHHWPIEALSNLGINDDESILLLG